MLEICYVFNTKRVLNLIACLVFAGKDDPHPTFRETNTGQATTDLFIEGPLSL